MTARIVPPGTAAEGYAEVADLFLDDATRIRAGEEHLPRDIHALAGIGYALLALREQLAEQPVPRRRCWWRGGAR